MNTTRQNWLQIALQVSGSVIPAILPRVILCTLFALLVFVLYQLDFPIKTRLLDNFFFGYSLRFVAGFSEKYSL